MVKKNIIALLLLFFSVQLFSSTEPDIKAYIDKKEVTVGEKIQYSVSFTKTDLIKEIKIPEKKVYFPTVKEPSDEKKAEDYVPAFEIRDIKENKDKIDNSELIKYTFEIVYFRPGSYMLPQLALFDDEGVMFGYDIPSVTVKTLNEKGEKISNEPPLALSGNYTRIILLVFGIVILTAIVVLLIIYLRKRIQNNKTIQPVIAPIEIFKKDIELLENKQLIQNGEKHEFIFELSHIFKKYLSLSMKADIREMTNDEVKTFIRKNISDFNRAESTALIETLSNIMDMWDLAKFAEFNPSEEMLNLNFKGTTEIAEKVIWEENNVRFRI